MTDNKKPINDKKEAKESPWTHFKNFFLNYFWFGLVLILVGMLISAESTNKYCQLLSQLLNTLGLAMFVAALFSFSFESVAFQQKMQSIVEKIVLARAFLNTLSREKKKEALHNILKPTESEIEKYSNLEDFYNTYIEDVLNVSQKNVRSNYNISLKAKYDATQDRVFTDGIYSYRLYPSEHGYTDILVGFLKEDELSSVDVFLNLPNGKRESFLYKDIQKTFTTNELIKQAKVVVNEICKPFSHVDVELRVKE
ncbi:hypothetical protein, partial [Thiomicrorhabdus sp.]|uniref:hypothetical protein n=1 Tax=Thiomicrorhabdus sp. TaxID=2039724 RepID=UPI003566B68C